MEDRVVQMNENSNTNMIQVPKELEETLNQIREIIRNDTLEYGRVPSLKNLADDLEISMEVVGECIIYLPTDEFCEFVPYLSQYEWELVSQISEMRNIEVYDGDETDDEDDEDYFMAGNFHFMT